MALELIGAFRGMDPSVLDQLEIDWMNCLQSLAMGGQSYAIAGRNMTRANLAEVKMIIAEIALAKGRISGGGFSAGGSFGGDNSIPFPSFSAPTTFAS